MNLDPLKNARQVIEQASAQVDDWLPAAMCQALLEGYHARWSDQQRRIAVREIETTHQTRLVNLDTMCSSRSFRIAGKIDKLAVQDGRLAIFDHKTTSQEIADLGGSFWRQLMVEAQPTHYELLLLSSGIQVEQVIWDVVRKPALRPRKLTPSQRDSLRDNGTYLGQAVSRETAQRFWERENRELYEVRLTQEVLQNPNRYFARRGVSRTREELAEYAQELWQIGQEILSARRNNRWYRNSGACMVYGTPCKFLGVCSGHDSIESERWGRKPHPHAELPAEVQEEPLDLLTPTRARSFQTCRRKHYYEYELGAERLEEKPTEALYFGGLWGRTLDAYWAAISPPQPGCTVSERSRHGHSSQSSNRQPIRRQPQTRCSPA